MEKAAEDTLTRVLGQMKVYKNGQGMAARWTGAALVMGMALYGCYALYDYPSHEGWWGDVLFSLGALDLELKYGLLVSLALAVGLAILDFRFVVNHPRVADFLIETEAELRKVSWPAKHEYLNASFVVILSVMILSFWLVFSDVAISWLLRLIGY